MLPSVTFYIQMCSHSDCANCVRAKYVEALRLAWRKMHDEGIPATNKQKLEEYALSAVNTKLKCYECLMAMKASTVDDKISERI
jgi:hypothetical protein